MLEPKPPVFRKVGYSCQTLLARRVNERLHPGVYYCWFSEEFNPKGGNSSNPCWRYRTFDHAVKEQDFGDAYLQDARQKLVNALNLALTKAYDLLNPPQGQDNVQMARDIITTRHSGIEWFRPQIWRLELGQIAGRYSSGHQYWHEHRITDLTCGEFETIIE
jgi:hypothetical protein